MRRFLDEAELSMPYSSTASLVTREDTNERSAEDKGEVSAEDDCRQAKAISQVCKKSFALSGPYSMVMKNKGAYDAQQGSESDDSEDDS